MRNPPLANAPRSGPPPPKAATGPLAWGAAHADRNGTVLAVVTMLVVAFTLPGSKPSEMGNFAAYGFALALGITIFCDIRAGGPRNAIRTDVLAITAFFFLTFFEFLFPQPVFDTLVTSTMARNGLRATLLAAAALMVGRHLYVPKKPPFERVLTTQVPPGALISIYVACFAIGYFHMIIAVDFDVMRMINCFMDPRFSQPWTRGRLGDWKALLVELGMFINLLPPLSGIILARHERYSKGALCIVACGLAFTLFFGFTSGTRNILATYLVTLLIGYVFAVKPHEHKRMLTMLFVCAAAMVIATPMMLHFRNVGFKRWITDPPNTSYAAEDAQTVFVDYNLYPICEIIDKIPRLVNYLGFEIPYTAIIRPIPRAIWPGKPEGLSYTIEEAIGAEGLTISATFVGEAWMSYGLIGVLICGLLMGAIFGWWNYTGTPANSELGILVYASGFFSAVISMRSILVFTTAILPTIGAIVATSFIVKQIVALEQRLRRNRPPPGPRRPMPGLKPRRTP